MWDNLRERFSKREELISRLEPYAKGCLSGKVSEWPQLNPLLKDIYNYLKQNEDYNE